MIAPLSSFAASPALASLRGLTSMRMGGGEYKPWDVKQEGGQMDSGWGTGNSTFLVLLSSLLFVLYCLSKSLRR